MDTSGRIGDTSLGTLSVDGGSDLLSSSAVMGFAAGSKGTTSISGVDSSWTVKAGITVGNSGTGTMNIEAGGHVTNTFTYLGFYSGSTGTVNVTGTNSSWTNASLLAVGYAGNGSITISAGGQASSGAGFLGDNTGTTGTALVTGMGSLWTNTGDLFVGRNGSGKLTVSDGGTVATTTLYASPADLLGNGTIAAAGAVLDTNLTFDNSHGLQQTVPFGTGGLLNLNLDGTGALGIGLRSSATLRIADGLTVSSTVGYLGYRSGSAGSATATGANTKWVNFGNLYIGNAGSGSLRIEDGAEVIDTYAYVNYSSTSAGGSVTVTGPGAKWTNSKDLNIGNSYHPGTLNIDAGGVVSNLNSWLIGSVTITGADSKWLNSGRLVIDGTLNIGSASQDGGLVSAMSLTLDSYAGTVACNLNRGAILQTGNVSAGGYGSYIINWNDGTIQNYNAATNLSISNTPSVKLAATGTHAFKIDLNRTGQVNAVLSDATSGGTLKKNGPGTLVLAAANIYSGGTTIEEGVFKVTGSILNTSGISVGELGTLELAKISSSATAANLAIDNSGTILISAGSQKVGTIIGSGITQVNPGATLTAASITQGSLIIGTTGAGAGSMSATSTMNSVPEPGSLALLLLGVVGMLLYVEKRQNART